MIELSIEVTSVAHGIHYAVVGIGLVGVFVLLGPHLVGDRSPRPARDDHSLRVSALTEQITSGGLGLRLAPAPTATPARREVADPVRARHLPMAIVSSAAAAGVHAAVGPAHFRELIVFGLFFAGCALAQMAWSLIMAIRPSRALLVMAIAGNGAVLSLWLVTRTVGLPGLLAGPEAVGPWDVLAVTCELFVVLTAGRILRAGAGTDLRLPAWPDWDPLARGWAIGSALLLTVLMLLGAGA